MQMNRLPASSLFSGEAATSLLQGMASARRTPEYPNVLRYLTSAHLDLQVNGLKSLPFK